MIGQIKRIKVKSKGQGQILHAEAVNRGIVRREKNKEKGYQHGVLSVCKYQEEFVCQVKGQDNIENL